MNAIEHTKADPNRSFREDELVAKIEEQAAYIRVLERELAATRTYVRVRDDCGDVEVGGTSGDG